MLKILKASAGSGKTYHLAKEYIRLVIGSDKPDAYRHVLAVTFTNKATDEMKRRILKELHTLATDPADSKYAKDLLPLVDGNVEELRQRALRQLSGILHDYSAFAVSTIDRFFQQTLRAFSREVGQFSTYQVQLDREALVQESVDRLLDGLTEEDTALLEWLTQGVKADLAEAGRLNLEGRLLQMAGSIHQLPEEELIFSRDRLKQLHARCEQLIRQFRDRVRQAAAAVLAVLEGEGVSPADSNRGFLKALYAYANLGPKDKLEMPTDSFLDKAADSAKWFAKSKDALRVRLEGILDEPLAAFAGLFDLPFREYTTALTIRSQVYSLGVAGEIRRSLTEVQKEKNQLSLDDSNTLIRDIIDGSDAPFIYEKLGVRFEDFLLDEFQDTAQIQWENFRPLLLDSQASGKDSLVVGDVKQSIYRWRGSDWELLGGRLEQEFGPSRTRVEVLGGNYRTCREIVAFNNDWFSYLAGALDAYLGQDPAQEGSISSLYADVAQQPCFTDPAPGSVDVVFKEDAEAQIQEILDTLSAFRAKGGRWGDIAILVRGNAEGVAVAKALVEEGIPVVSDDSLYVKASVTVRRLISQLSLMDAPAGEEDRPSVAAYLARSLHVTLPDHYHSLPDLCEQLLQDLRAADPDTFHAEIPYIQSFMDYLQDWSVTGGHNLGAFLRAWEQADPKIVSPGSGDAVRVMTIHKSKGLEFPFVIVPFVEKVTLYKAPQSWCAPQVQGTQLEKEAEGVFRVSLDKSAGNSLFRKDYLKEQQLQAVDAINVLYVAFTRPKYGLKVIAARSTKADLAQFLYAYTEGKDLFRGAAYPPDKVPASEEAPALIPASYPSFPAGGSRLQVSPEAVDYFGPDGSFGMEASRRIRGNVLHGILARVGVPADLEPAVQAAVAAGDLPLADAPEVERWLQERLASVAGRGWFAPQAKVLCEASILAPDGLEYRPDRVIIHPDGHVDVVDYKFGHPEERYQWQVRRYVSLYRRMGHEKVAGYLWYLEENRVQDV